MGIPAEFQLPTILVFAFAMLIHASRLMPYMAGGEPFYRTFIVGLAVLLIRSAVSLAIMVLLTNAALRTFGHDFESRTVVAGAGLFMGFLVSVPIGELLTRLITGVYPKHLLRGW